MDQTEWLNRSVEERLEWYTSEIDRLIRSLDASETKSSKEILQEIKKRMIFDGTPSDNRMSEESEKQKGYYKSIYKAYKTLPNVGDDQEEWNDNLARSKEILNTTA
ncbi:hypothetical protein NC796_04080 [Aliifodinibius sp. S!AR15-10]|uniref:hypothetical protein n=1 Tax=Aliifodinibius sp. S!AR15-10 TaxID=2950437 RepID=UPI00285DF75F|nr:hypothetical protein [Aliifodinibius sp. S!AR15-10]MDR8390306.1 hypothetical protein [Aliifodinibius sp. S!AR15-10]